MVKSASHPVVVLSVGPIDEHQVALAEILCRSSWAWCPPAKWTLEFCSDLEASLPILQCGGIPIVICDADNDTGAWREMLDELAFLPHPPLAIVGSRLADNRLWAEALHLGAHDVLSKPFDPVEVSRVFSTAWLRWQGRFSSSQTGSLLAAS